MHAKIEKYYHSFGKVRDLGMYLSGFIVFIMMLYTCADVVYRNIQGFSPLYAYEISQSYFMPLIIFPGLAFAFSTGIMPRIDFIVEKFSKNKQKLIHVILFVIELILILLLIVYGTQYMIQAIESGQSFTAGGNNFPLWPVILFVPLGLLMVFVEIIFQLLKTIYK
ncbi:TRAP transporter small permease [Oceanobacillus sp. CAU 1775]